MALPRTMIRRWIPLFLALSVTTGCQAPHATEYPSLPIGPPAWEVRFSPNGGGTELIVRTLGEATATVQVQAYSFTSPPIAQALVEVHRRGVRVEVILDKSQLTARGSQAGFLAQAGIPVWIDAAHAIAHNKVMVVDGATVITGSFNFTESAETRNAENLLVLRNPELAARYEANWRQHQEHSNPYP